MPAGGPASWFLSLAVASETRRNRRWRQEMTSVVLMTAGVGFMVLALTMFLAVTANGEPYRGPGTKR